MSKRLREKRNAQHEDYKDRFDGHPRFIGTIEDVFPLPIHRTEAGYPNCATCDGGGCHDCTDPAT